MSTTTQNHTTMRALVAALALACAATPRHRARVRT